MALTGDRLRQLVQANAVNRNKKRRLNRQRSATTGEEDREDDDDEAERLKKQQQQLENGVNGDCQYISCYAIASKGRFGKDKWILPFNHGSGRSSAGPPSPCDTYTAVVTEDLAFKRLELKDLPPSVKTPRSNSLNTYVFDAELTEWIRRKNSAGPQRRISRRTEEPLVPPRRYTIKDDEYGLPHDGGGVRSAPPIPPKPDYLSQQPPFMKLRETRKNQRATQSRLDGDDYSKETSPVVVQPQQEPPLPLPPRKNRPSQAATTTVLKTEPEVRKSNENGTQATRGRSSQKDEEDNHYEPVESQNSKTAPVGQDVVQLPIKIANKKEEKTFLDETQESDSVFDRSSDGSCSDPGERSDLSRLNDVSESTLVPSNSVSPPLNGRLDSDSTLPAGSELVLPKVFKERVVESTDSDSGESDTYEDIDAHRLRQHGLGDSSPRDSCGYDTVADASHADPDWLVVHWNDIVIVEVGEVCPCPAETNDSETAQKESANSATTQPVLSSDDLARFAGTSLSYDKDGNAIYLPSDKLKVYGDPTGEPWFYPLELTSREATLFLRNELQEGCFIVYKPSVPSTGVAYNLSLNRSNGDVLHYHIMEGPEGGLMIEGHDHSFLNLADLVQYFGRNKSTLATRLRRPLKEARLPIIAGYHYDLKYELDRDRLSLTGSIIGKGNFGVVCSGVYKGSPVAVKVLQGTEVSLEDEDDFIEEARILMMLRHSNIVGVIGVSSSARPFFIVTEFVQHGSLKECLRNGRIPTDKPDLLVDISLQILAALSYLESLKYVLHRDIAARNFLVSNLKCIKLADFGRARFVTDDNYQAPRTEKISIKWAAPEVLIDFTYSTKSDVWATGVAIWEVFSVGERPYETLSAEQTAVYVTEGGRLPRPALCLGDMYSLVRKCWRRSASSRPSASLLQQTILENRRAAFYRRNQAILDASKNRPISDSASGKMSLKSPTLKKKNLDGDSASGKQRFSTIRDVFMSSSFRESHSPKKSNSPERFPTSSSSENVSSHSSAPDPKASQKIRSSFRKLIITKKIRSNSKSKADYIENPEKPRRPATTSQV